MSFRIHTCGHVIPEGAPADWELSICTECCTKRLAALAAIGYVEIPRKKKRRPTCGKCSVCGTEYPSVWVAGECCKLEKASRRDGNGSALRMRGTLKDGLVRRKWNGGA